MIDLLRLLALEDRSTVTDSVIAQAVDVSIQKTRSDKDYLAVTLNDGKGEVKLKVWNNDPSFAEVRDGGRDKFWKISGDWTNGEYGVEVKKGEWTVPAQAEVDALMAGGADLLPQLDKDWTYIKERVAAISHPGLRLVGERVINDLGEKYRRAAAARQNHHARRGGLLTHVAQMIRVGQALLPCYPQANSDILVLATMFHDIGKIYENDYGTGFSQKSTFTAEMMGHIAIGQQTFIGFYNDARAAQPAAFPPELEMVKGHIIHCILAHHGQAEWGSPVDPKSPEAFILHCIDMMDAKLEMLRHAYEINNKTVDGMVAACYPLKGSVAIPYNDMIKAAGKR